METTGNGDLITQSVGEPYSSRSACQERYVSLQCGRITSWYWLISRRISGILRGRWAHIHRFRNKQTTLRNHLVEIINTDSEFNLRYQSFYQCVFFSGPGCCRQQAFTAFYNKWEHRCVSTYNVLDVQNITSHIQCTKGASVRNSANSLKAKTHLTYGQYSCTTGGTRADAELWLGGNQSFTPVWGAVCRLSPACTVWMFYPSTKHSPFILLAQRQNHKSSLCVQSVAWFTLLSALSVHRCACLHAFQSSICQCVIVCAHNTGNDTSLWLSGN